MRTGMISMKWQIFMTIFIVVVATRTMINVILYHELKNSIAIQCFMLRKMGKQVREFCNLTAYVQAHCHRAEYEQR